MTEPDLTAMILDGLRASPRRLPAQLLYDALGSALFEAITLLPEYGVARADLRLIERHAAEVVRAIPGPVEVVELGPGGGRKAVAFLTRLRAIQPRIDFTAIDVSAAALAACAQTVSACEGVTARGVEATYLAGLRGAPHTADRRLVLFLGSNLSNFERNDAQRFLRDLRDTLRPGDALLLATDLVKPPELLLPAYDDALGVTSAFNRNVLTRLNREWGMDFDLSAFAHRARWDGAARRIEMHLVATRATSATHAGETFAFEPGETIWTESSHRFDTAELRTWATECGYETAAQWIDGAWAFAHTLLVARGSKGETR